jgi:hypothetical protein
MLLNEHLPLAMALAVRPDGKMIAIGFGSSVHIYVLSNNELQKACQLDAQSSHTTGSVRFQRLNFSLDSKKFISAIQVSLDASSRQAVHVRTWNCFGVELRDMSQLDPVYLTVVRNIPGSKYESAY